MDHPFSAVSARRRAWVLAAVCMAAVALPLVAWGTLSPAIRNAPSLARIGAGRDRPGSVVES